MLSGQLSDNEACAEASLVIDLHILRHDSGPNSQCDRGASWASTKSCSVYFNRVTRRHVATPRRARVPDRAVLIEQVQTDGPERNPLGHVEPGVRRDRVIA